MIALEDLIVPPPLDWCCFLPLLFLLLGGAAFLPPIEWCCFFLLFLSGGAAFLPLPFRVVVVLHPSFGVSLVFTVLFGWCSLHFLVVLMSSPSFFGGAAFFPFFGAL